MVVERIPGKDNGYLMCFFTLGDLKWSAFAQYLGIVSVRRIFRIVVGCVEEFEGFGWLM